ncbi:MAG: cytochrome c oxidase subunit I, partial [Gemmatimonadaceae bacterium]
GAAPDGGWFAYLPLNDRQYSPGINMDFWDIGLSVAEVSALGAAAELIVGILRMRAPGMSLRRMPIFAWAMLVTSFMLILAFTPLVVATAMLELDRKGLTHFFTVGRGGDPVLWQHLFWIFGHPEVYIMFLPAAGAVSHIVQTFSQRPLVGYRAMVMAMMATGALSFTLWVHHMFATGMSATVMSIFTAASMLIAIPSGVQVCCWLATIWLGRPEWKTPMLFVAGFLMIFVLGGITGVMVAVVPFDAQVHDSYFVVAHFHYVLIGGVVFPLFGALYYWLPKMTGRQMNERLGQVNFWLMFIFFNLAFFPMHISGLLGMPRRVYTYSSGMGWDVPNLISTIGAFGFASGVLLGLLNALWSRKHGAEAGSDPWHGDTLEWAETSPPAEAQFSVIPVVHGRHPMWEQQTLAADDVVTQVALRDLHVAPVQWRGALCVTMRDARPAARVHLPGPTIWPFVLSVAMLVLFVAALLDSVLLVLLGAGLTAVALVGWFRPPQTLRLALAESQAADRPGILPLGVHGRLSNGWWGTLVMLLILASALATIVGSYWYLANQWERWSWEPPDAMESLLAGVAIPIAIASAVLTASASRADDERGVPRRRVGLTLAALVAVVECILIWLLYSYREASLTRAVDAHGSLVFLMLVFLGATTLLHLVMILVAAAWAWRAPDDPLGLAPAKNGGLVGAFVVLCWVAVVVTVYSPAIRS